jgi:CubicO group peptidase (beta-lactamase class C family)
VRLPAFLALLLLAPGLPASREDLLNVDRFITAEMARQRIPGVAVAVIRKGETLIANGYGLADVEHDVPVTPATIFQSGSVGKQFTAAAAMLLVEDGRLALSDPMTKFFADAPEHWKVDFPIHMSDASTVQTHVIPARRSHSFSYGCPGVGAPRPTVHFHPGLLSAKLW